MGVDLFIENTLYSLNIIVSMLTLVKAVNNHYITFKCKAVSMENVCDAIPNLPWNVFHRWIRFSSRVIWNTDPLWASPSFVGIETVLCVVRSVYSVLSCITQGENPRAYPLTDPTPPPSHPPNPGTPERRAERREEGEKKGMKARPLYLQVRLQV